MRGMKVLCFSLIALAIMPSARAEVRVTFTAPENYVDAELRDRGPRARDLTLKVIREQLVRLGERYLVPDQTLEVEVLDVDLAGELEWWHGPYDIRFLRSVTWPRIKLRYTLKQGDATIRSSEESISDPSYQMNVIAATRSGEVMPYEKEMLARWFRTRFAAG